MKRAIKPPLPQELLAIAILHLDSSLTTLQTRHSDDLDFREVSVWGIEAALRAAYEAGWKVRAGKEE